MKWLYFFELHRNVDHSQKRVMKWVYFFELYRNVDHFQTRLIGVLCAFFLTYPLSRHFTPVCGGCWLWYFRNGWGSWIRRLCGTVLRFGKLDRVHVKKPTDMKLDFEINIYLYVSFVVQVFKILKEYLTKFSIDEIWSSSWMMNVGSYEKGKIKKIRNTMYE